MTVNCGTTVSIIFVFYVTFYGIIVKFYGITRKDSLGNRNCTTIQFFIYRFLQCNIT